MQRLSLLLVLLTTLSLSSALLTCGDVKDYFQEQSCCDATDDKAISATCTKSNSKDRTSERSSKVVQYAFLYQSLEDMTQLMANKSPEDKKTLYNMYMNGLDVFDEETNAILDTLSSEDILHDHMNSGVSGVPIWIKGNFDVKGLPNSAGSLALIDNYPSRDSHIVSKLKAAGFVIPGTTTLSEFGNSRHPAGATQSGWSSYSNLTVNAYSPDGDKYNAMGSSTGSCVLVSKGLTPVAIGTETRGSITIASSVNGVVGFKPSTGLVSRDGLIQIQPMLDSPGPIARSVSDAAQVLKVIAGRDDNDPVTSDIPESYDYEALTNLDSAYLHSKRVGLLPCSAYLTGSVCGPVQEQLRERVKHVIAAAGGTVVDVSMPVMKPLATFNSYMLGKAMTTYRANSGERMRTIEDIVSFNERHSSVAMELFGQDNLLAAVEAYANGRNVTFENEMNVLLAENEEILRSTFEEQNITALLHFPWGPASPINLQTMDFTFPKLDPIELIADVSFFYAEARAATATVPVQLVNGLPVGVSITAPRWMDSVALNVAHAFEFHNGFITRP